MDNNLILFFFNFTILYWFCYISTWLHHRYTHVPHPEPSSVLPPRTISLGLPSAPAPSIQYRALNLDWWLISYMILYMFQCHSPKWSHPLPNPSLVGDFFFHILMHFSHFSPKMNWWFTNRFKCKTIYCYIHPPTPTNTHSFKIHDLHFFTFLTEENLFLQLLKIFSLF